MASPIRVQGVALTYRQAHSLAEAYRRGGLLQAGGPGGMECSKPVVDALRRLNLIEYAGAVPKGRAGGLWRLTAQGNRAGRELDNRLRSKETPLAALAAD